MEQKIILSGDLKGLNTSQKTSNNNTLDTFIRCANAYTKDGSLIKFRPPLSVPNLVPTSNGSGGPGIFYVASKTGVVKSKMYLISMKNIGYAECEAYTTYNGLETVNAINSITTLASDPNATDQYKFARFINGSSDDILYFQNGSSNFNLHTIKIIDNTYAHLGTPTYLATCNSLCVNNSRLFAGVGSKLFYSKVDDGSTWDVTWFLQIPNNSFIRDLYVINQFIIIFCDNGIYTLTGNDTTTFDLNQLSNGGSSSYSVDGTTNECYYVDNNNSFRKISINANYGSIDSSIAISDNILSRFEFDTNNYTSGKSDFLKATIRMSKVTVCGDFVYFGIYLTYTTSTPTASGQPDCYIYNAKEKTFFQHIFYYDQTLATTNAWPFFYGCRTMHSHNVQGNIIYSYDAKGLLQSTQVPHDTGCTALCGTAINTNSFMIYSGRLTLGNNNNKVLQKIYLDISTFGTAGDVSFGLIIYDEEENEIYTTLTSTITIDVNKDKWICLPRMLRSRAFYIKLVTNYTGGLRLNKWGLMFLDQGIKAFYV